MMTESSHFFKLPEEIQGGIFKHFTPIEHAKVCRVSKQFNRLLEDELLWKRYLTEAGIENAKKNGVTFREWFGRHLDDLTTEGLESHPLGQRYQEIQADLESKRSYQKSLHILDVDFREDTVNIKTICCSAMLINMILKDKLSPCLFLLSLLEDHEKHIVLLGLKTVLESPGLRKVFEHELCLQHTIYAASLNLI